MYPSEHDPNKPLAEQSHVMVHVPAPEQKPKSNGFKKVLIVIGLLFATIALLPIWMIMMQILLLVGGGVYLDTAGKCEYEDKIELLQSLPANQLTVQGTKKIATSLEKCWSANSGLIKTSPSKSQYVENVFMGNRTDLDKVKAFYLAKMSDWKRTPRPPLTDARMRDNEQLIKECFVANFEFYYADSLSPARVDSYNKLKQKHNISSSLIYTVRFSFLGGSHNPPDDAGCKREQQQNTLVTQYQFPNNQLVKTNSFGYSFELPVYQPAKQQWRVEDTGSSFKATRSDGAALIGEIRANTPANQAWLKTKMEAVQALPSFKHVKFLTYPMMEGDGSNYALFTQPDITWSAIVATDSYGVFSNYTVAAISTKQSVSFWLSTIPNYYSYPPGFNSYYQDGFLSTLRVAE